MKLFCANCAQTMRLLEVAGPDEGTMSITFGCAACGNRTSLLTNPGETQLIRSLDVHIGGRIAPPEPMGLVRSALALQRDEAFVSPSGAPQPEKRVIWTEEALRRLENVPPFVRDMARKSIERYALQEGLDKITPQVMDRAREAR